MSRLLFCLLLLCALPTHGGDLRVYLHNTEGASYIDSSGELRGKHHLGRPALLVELVRTLMITAEIKPLMTNVSRSQGKELLASQPDSALVDISPEPNLLPPDKWVGPILNDSVYFFSYRKNKHLVRSIQDAKKVPSICVRRSTNHAKLLGELGFNNVVEASSYRVCWDKLVNGEATLTTLGGNIIPAITQLAKDIAADIKNTGIKLHDQNSYIVFSRDTPTSQIQRWQTSLNLLKNTPNYQTLIHHFYCQQDCF
ncbi:MAG: hypothetical protein V7677_04480 [Motiliproteus sp.]